VNDALAPLRAAGLDDAAIFDATAELLRILTELNGLRPDDIGYVWFTVTPDLDAAFPADAARAPAEEFLYVACLHRGTGVEKPDFLAVVDAEDGRIVSELPMSTMVLTVPSQMRSVALAVPNASKYLCR